MIKGRIIKSQSHAVLDWRRSDYHSSSSVLRDLKRREGR